MLVCSMPLDLLKTLHSFMHVSFQPSFTHYPNQQPLVPSGHYLATEATFIDENYVETMWTKTPSEKAMWILCGN